MPAAPKAPPPGEDELVKISDLDEWAQVGGRCAECVRPMGATYTRIRSPFPAPRAFQAPPPHASIVFAFPSTLPPSQRPTPSVSHRHSSHSPATSR